VRIIGLLTVALLTLCGAPQPAAAQDAAAPNPGASPAPPGHALDAAMPALLDGVLGAAVEAGRTSAAVGVYVRDGEVRFAKGYGFEDPARTEPVTPEQSRFQIASISKTFTAALLAQLQAAGRIGAWSDPARRYLPDAALPESVRLQDLATHTAGFDERLFARYTNDPAERVRAIEWPGGQPQPRLFHGPGAPSAYSNLGIDYLGDAASAAAGAPYPELLRDQLLLPLGMTSAAALISDQDIPHLVQPFDPAAPSRTTPRLFVKQGSLPSGGIIATPSEMGRFLIALTGGAPDVLSPAMLQSLYSPLHQNHPAGSAHGLILDLLSLGPRAIAHHGGTLGGFQCWLAVNPGDRTGLFYCFVQHPDGGAQPPLSIQEAAVPLLGALLLGGPPTGAPPAAAGPPPAASAPEALEPFAGTYLSLRRHHFGRGRLRALLQPDKMQVRVSETGLRINGAEAAPLGGGAFIAPDGLESWGFFTDPATGRMTLSARTLSTAYQKPSWRDSPALMQSLGLTLAALWATALAGLVYGGVARWGAAAAGVGLALFGGALAVLDPFGERYLLGQIWPLAALQAGAALTPLGALAFLIAALRGGRGRAIQAHLLLLSVAGVALTLWLANAGMFSWSFQ